MKIIYQHLLVLATVSCLSSGALAQIDPQLPLVDYPDRPGHYLQRLHVTDSKVGKGTLSFRQDFPGGFAAWQKASRKELQALLGLDQIQQSAKGHKTTVQLGDVTVEDGYTRQRADIQTEPGVAIPFWLLRPVAVASQLRPLAICSHGHDSDGWNTYAKNFS